MELYDFLPKQAFFRTKKTLVTAFFVYSETLHTSNYTLKMTPQRSLESIHFCRLRGYRDKRIPGYQYTRIQVYNDYTRIRVGVDKKKKPPGFLLLSSSS